MIKKLTQKEVKKSLHYNPDTGLFFWINNRTGKPKAGDLAGTLATDGYRKISVCNKTYMEHRLAFLYITGSLPYGYVDHINHIRNDNRWCNLREVTCQENQKNQKLGSRNTSGIIGVRYDSNRGKWVAHMTSEGKALYLGRFNDKDEAIQARKTAEIKYGFHKNHGNT